MVKQVLDSLQINNATVTLGRINVDENLSAEQYKTLRKLVEAEGFALVENEKQSLLNR